MLIIVLDKGFKIILDTAVITFPLSLRYHGPIDSAFSVIVQLQTAIFLPSVFHTALAQNGA
jgi:hypothetical protein